MPIEILPSFLLMNLHIDFIRWHAVVVDIEYVHGTQWFRKILKVQSIIRSLFSVL